MTPHPILLIAVPLAVAFLIPLLGRLGRGAALAAHAATSAFVAATGALWLARFAGGAQAVTVSTGGWLPPVGIGLRLDTAESLLVLLAGLAGLVGAWQLRDREDVDPVRSSLLQLLVLVGGLGLIMTRDLFNLFVFLEISSIGTYALVALGDRRDALEAGFKYMMLGSVASVFLLIGIAFVYKLCGTLALDDLAGRPEAIAAAGPVLLLLFVGLMIEAKLVPVNGPALDLYEGVEPGVMALLVGTTVNGVLFAVWKLLPLFPLETWAAPIMAVGMATFVLSNLLALGTGSGGRMLGYSSSAQIGLLVFLMPLLREGVVPPLAAGLLLANHALAKASLLWGVERGEENPAAARAARIASVLAIVALPPFAGFWGKWLVVESLARGGMGGWLAVLLVGSLLEFAYYFRWLAGLRGDARREIGHAAGPALFALLGLGLGLWAAQRVGETPELAILGLAGAGLALLAARTLPEKLRGWIVVLAAPAAAWSLGADALAPTTLPGLFTSVTLLGLLVSGLAAAGLGRVRGSFHGLLLILAASLLLLFRTSSLLMFFAAWEIMTWSSYLLLGRGRGAAAGYLYMLFSGAAGFLVLGGLAVALAHGADGISGLAMLSGRSATLALGLLTAGFLCKAAAWGTHLWAPDAYAESPDAFTPFLSGVVSKAPMFGLLAVAFRVAAATGAVEPLRLVGWLGGLTALGMTLLAAFQEDVKRLLAYSSVGQVGYIVAGLAVMSPLGWSAALFHVVHHLLFKAMLFAVAAGVIHRTGTRTMYEMGGLIRRMPWSFTAMLIGIIALSGVPPLAGFTGKWLLYQSLLEAGWLPLMTVLMFASVVAFLYLFRMIHAVFLGQLKPVHREVREAPWPLLVGQYVMIAGIMALSMKPALLLAPLGEAVAGRLGDGGARIVEGGRLLLPSGYFDAMTVMTIVMVLFGLLLAFLLIVGPRPKRVRQLDIVYSGEVPPPPEEIHFAADFLMPYEKAWAPWLRPRVTAFWNGVAATVAGVVAAGRRLYSGNGQTYVLYSLLTVVVLALLGLGKVVG